MLTLLRYIKSIDIFCVFYKKYVAKRLLLHKSISHILEKSIISKIKNQCGAAYCNQLESMFKDMKTSNEINLTYQQMFSAEGYQNNDDILAGKKKK